MRCSSLHNQQLHKLSFHKENKVLIKDLETIKQQAFIYYLDENTVVIAGKTARDNDFISLKVAAQDDWWFHVKGMPGSHVLLRKESGESPSKNELETAASIAAYHSKGRNGGTVAVSMCLAKNVSKPRGSKNGLVQITKEKVFKVKPMLP